MQLSRRVKRLCRIFYYYAITVGMTSNTYFTKKYKYQSIWLTKVTAFSVNILAIVGLSGMNRGASSFVYKISHNSVMLVAYRVLMYTRLIDVVYCILNRWTREKNILKLIKQVALLDEQYFSNLSNCAQLDYELNRILYWRFFTLMFICTSIINGVISTLHVLSYEDILWTIIFAHALNLAHCTEFSFYLFIWNIYRRVRYINHQLLIILEHFQSLQAAQDSEHWHDWHRAQSAYHKLKQILYKFNETSKMQNLALRFNTFTYNVTVGYMFASYFFTLAVSKPILFHFMFGFIFTNFNQYLFDSLCSRTINACQTTIDILGRVAYSLPTYQSVSQLSEQFVMQLHCLKLQVSFCDVYVIDKSFWFQMSSITLSFIIVLWQFHLQEQYRHIIMPEY